MADVYCAKCAEPWDAWCLRKEFTPCDNPDCIDGQVSIDATESETCPEGGLYWLGNNECPSEPCGACRGHFPHEDTPYGSSGNTRGPNRLQIRGYLKWYREYLGSTHGDGGPGFWHYYRTLHEDIDDGWFKCDKCDGNGYHLNPDRCDQCDCEFDYGHPYGDTIVIGDGALYCLDCSVKNGWVIQWKDCPECNGTENVEVETDLGTHEDINRFRRGEGCPCCDWGYTAETVTWRDCPTCLAYYTGGTERISPADGRVVKLREPSSEALCDCDNSIEIKAARSAMDASDEDPMLILQERGLI